MHPATLRCAAPQTEQRSKYSLPASLFSRGHQIEVQRGHETMLAIVFDFIRCLKRWRQSSDSALWAARRSLKAIEQGLKADFVGRHVEPPPKPSKTVGFPSNAAHGGLSRHVAQVKTPRNGPSIDGGDVETTLRGHQVDENQRSSGSGPLPGTQRVKPSLP